jgi:chaperone modulatory protein CbpM
MTSEHTGGIWLTDDEEITMTEIVNLSGLSESELHEMVHYGAIEPVDPDTTPWRFTARSLTILRSAQRLRVGFDLEPHAVAVVISLLERIRDLESLVAGLRARLPRDDNPASSVDVTE